MCKEGGEWEEKVKGEERKDEKQEENRGRCYAQMPNKLRLLEERTQR